MYFVSVKLLKRTYLEKPVRSVYLEPIVGSVVRRLEKPSPHTHINVCVWVYVCACVSESQCI